MKASSGAASSRKPASRSDQNNFFIQNKWAWRNSHVPPPLYCRSPQDHWVTKRIWGAFTGTNLDVYLKSQGVTQIVIAGVATSMGVESTAHQAHEHGYNVTLAIDAMTDVHPASSSWVNMA